jgi:hypothetical protein
MNSISGTVARKMTVGDIRQQTDASGKPAVYRDGRPKIAMVVPLIIDGEGEALWMVRGQARDELARAMADAGCAPASMPEAGAELTITAMEPRTIPGHAPQPVVKVTYTRPVKK